MTPDDTALPTLVAPPLSPAASFDPAVAEQHGVERLEGRGLARNA